MGKARCDVGPGRAARVRGWPVLTLVGAAGAMTMLDATTTYAAMPQIQSALDLRTGDLHWVMSCYLVSFGGTLLCAPRVAAVAGHRRLFILGIAAFTVASVLAGIAWAGGILVLARAVQGAASALMAPTLLPLLATTFGAAGWQRRATGVWTALGAFGGTVGLLVGGLLPDGPGWRWIFLGDAIVGLVVTAVSPFVLPRERGTGRRTVHLTAVVGVTAGVGLLAYGLTEGVRTGWSAARTIGSLILSAVALATSALAWAHDAQPLGPPRPRRSRSLLRGVGVLFVTGAAADGVLLLLTLYAQQALGFSATRFGLTVAVMTLSSVAGSFIGQLLAARGLRQVMSAGMVLLCAGMLLTATTADADFSAKLFFGLLVLGLGLGAAFVAAQIAVVSSFQDTGSPAPSGLADAAFTFGGVLGLASASAVLAARGADAAADPAHLVTALLMLGAATGLGILVAAVTIRRPVGSLPASGLSLAAVDALRDGEELDERP